MTGHSPGWCHPPKPPSCLSWAPEFKQKEECTIRGRSLIQISIQEDPWNLPSSIKTLVDNIQRYVEGQGRGGGHSGVCVCVHLCVHVCVMALSLKLVGSGKASSLHPPHLPRGRSRGAQSLLSVCLGEQALWGADPSSWKPLWSQERSFEGKGLIARPVSPHSRAVVMPGTHL